MTNGDEVAIGIRGYVLFGGQYCSDDGDTIIRTQWKQGQRCGI